jgi:hypothetical protein
MPESAYPLAGLLFGLVADKLGASVLWSAALAFALFFVAGLLFNDVGEAVGLYLLYSALGAFLAALLAFLGSLGGAVWRARSKGKTG